MFNLAKDLKELHGKKIAIATDNMDVFSTIIAKELKLNETFDAIINSADYGCLKTERSGKLFDKVLENLDEKIEDCLFIDNSPRSIEAFKEKGGQGFLYNNNFEELNNFLKINL